jgi:hypothetical protein
MVSFWGLKKSFIGSGVPTIAIMIKIAKPNKIMIKNATDMRRMASSLRLTSADKDDAEKTIIVIIIINMAKDNGVRLLASTTAFPINVKKISAPAIIVALI